MIKLNKTYIKLTLFFFLLEVFIACFVRDRFIRPYVGDVFVVMLLYCFVKSFFKINNVSAAISVLLFALLIEALQYLNVIKILPLENYKLAQIVIGTSFSWLDVMAYVVGICIVLLVEKSIRKSL